MTARKIILILGAVLVVVLALSAFKPDPAPAPQSPPSLAAQAADLEDKARQLRAIKVAQAIKDSLNNPKSFELVDSVYLADDTVCTVYRGTNAFNAVMTQQTAVTKDGKTGDWNKLCANKRGRDYSQAVRGRV